MTSQAKPQRNRGLWLFEPLQGEATPKRIWLWWEKRRLLYNILIVLLCALSLAVYAGSRLLSGLVPANSTTDDLIPSMGLLLAVYVGPIAWNVFYSLGPIIEIGSGKTNSKHDPTLGPRLLRVGLLISGIVISIPAILAVPQGLAFLIAHHR